jgi:hypothetical protein
LEGSESTNNGADDFIRLGSPTPNYPSVFLPNANKNPSPDTNAA